MNFLQMNSLLSLNNSMSTVKTLNSVDVKTQGEKGVLETEIKQDRENGVDTTAKEERIAEINEKHDAIQNTLNDIISNANEEAKDIASAGEDQNRVYEIDNEQTNYATYAEDEERGGLEVELHGVKLNISVSSSEPKTDSENSTVNKNVDLSV